MTLVETLRQARTCLFLAGHEDMSPEAVREYLEQAQEHLAALLAVLPARAAQEG